MENPPPAKAARRTKTVLYQLIYVSSAVGGAGSTVLSVADILGASDRNNRRDGITGLLSIANGRFLQVLEGTRIDLDRLMRRLREDTRHTDLTMLGEKPIRERAFGRWTMTRAVTPELSAFLTGDLESLTAARAERLLLDAAQLLQAA
jgi:hypothetical protein